MLMEGKTGPAPGSSGVSPARPNPQGKAHLLAFYSRRIRRVARSTLSAELQATSSGVETATWVAGMYDEIFGDCK